MAEIEPITLQGDVAALKVDIDKGLADLAEGRVQDFEISSIIERGRPTSLGAHLRKG